MATVPVTRTWVAGEVVLASHFNSNIRDVLNYLLSPPILEIYQSVAQTLTTSVVSPITMTSEVVDSSGMHSTSSDTSRAVAVYPGYYVFAGSIAFTGSAAGNRVLQWQKNGSASIASADATFPPWSASVNIYNLRTKLIFLNVGDYVESMGYQDSGGNLLTVASPVDVSSGMTAFWKSN